MNAESLYNIARKYVAVMEKIERTSDPEALMRLEEERVIWHNRFIEKLKREGIQFKDREHVTRLAYRFAKQEL